MKHSLYTLPIIAAISIIIISCSSSNGTTAGFTEEQRQENMRIATTADSLLTKEELEVKRMIENDYWDLYYAHVSFDNNYNMVFDASEEDFTSRGLDANWYYEAKRDVDEYNENIKNFSTDPIYLNTLKEQFENQKAEYQAAEDKSVLFTAIDYESPDQ